MTRKSWKLQKESAWKELPARGSYTAVAEMILIWKRGNVLRSPGGGVVGIFRFFNYGRTAARLPEAWLRKDKHMGEASKETRERWHLIAPSTLSTAALVLSSHLSFPSCTRIIAKLKISRRAL